MALAHCDECEACARRLEDESALSFRLRALAADSNGVTVPMLGNELLTALRGRQPAMILPAGARAGRSRIMVTTDGDGGCRDDFGCNCCYGHAPSFGNARCQQSAESIKSQNLPANDKIVKAPDLITDPLPSPLPKRIRRWQDGKPYATRLTEWFCRLSLLLVVTVKVS